MECSIDLEYYCLRQCYADEILSLNTIVSLIQQITGKVPESLDILKNLDLEEIAYEENDSAEEDLDGESEEEHSQFSSSYTDDVADVPLN